MPRSFLELRKNSMASVGFEGPLYRYLLGTSYEMLPPVIRAMHDVSSVVSAEGCGTVTHGTNVISRALRKLLGMPDAGTDRPLRVVFATREGHETITRSYPDADLVTHQSPAGPPGSGLLGERFGPVRLIIHLKASAERLDFELRRVLWRSIPLSRLLWPALEACETQEDDWYRFFVRVGMPVIGLLIQYEGRLKITAPRG